MLNNTCRKIFGRYKRKILKTLREDTNAKLSLRGTALRMLACVSVHSSAENLAIVFSSLEGIILRQLTWHFRSEGALNSVLAMMIQKSISWAFCFEVI